MKKRNWIVFFILIIPAAGCSKKKAPEVIPPCPVRVASAAQKDVPIYIQSFGNLAAPEDVNIVSQVAGRIQEVHFREGDAVAKGALLFTIDPVKYRAARDQAAAELAAARVDLKLKRDTLRRNRQLVAQKLISEQEFDTYYSAVAASSDRVELDEAALRGAAADLNYCFIRSPIDGITGKRLVDPGNVVPENTGPVLVNVKRIDPLYVDFTVPERDFSRLREARAEGALRVLVFTPGEEGAPVEGQLKMIDNTISNSTGTIALRAEAANPGRTLWPGEFVTVKLIVGTARGAVVVPETAVQLGHKGKYLYTIGPGKKADLRDKIRVGPSSKRVSKRGSWW